MRDLEVRRYIPWSTERQRRMEQARVWLVIATFAALGFWWLLR